MKFTDRARQIFFTDRDQVNEIQTELVRENLRSLEFFSLVCMVTFAVMTLGGIIVPTLRPNLVVYAIYFGASLFFFIAARKCRSDKLAIFLVYFYMAFMLLFGILIGAVLTPEEISASFVVLMFAMPTLFTARPENMNIVILGSIIVYAVVAYFTESEFMLLYNLITIMSFGLASMLIDAYLQNVKLQRLYLIKKNAYLVKKDQKTVESKENYESFINEMLRSASDISEPETAINALLEFIGTRLSSDRAYIFEDNGDQTYDNTYEWCREGVTSEMDHLKGLPYKGLMEVWFKQYKRSHNILIYNIEDYKKVSKSMYELLKPQGIQTLVTGPIVINGKMVGFYGVDNPPIETMKSISELINAMEFAFSMLLQFRDNNRAIGASARHDALTGCKNRNALSWIYNHEFERGSSIALIMCDLNGLKHVNDLQGHVAGDIFLSHIADTLKDSFGKDNVYRIGGDEFIVILLNRSLQEMQEKTEALKLTLGNSASIGLEYRERLDITFDEMLKAADRKMYEEKNRYYDAHPEMKLR